MASKKEETNEGEKKDKKNHTPKKTQKPNTTVLITEEALKYCLGSMYIWAKSPLPSRGDTSI